MHGALAVLLLLSAQAGRSEVEALESDDPAVREQAEGRLLDLGTQVEPLLRRAMADGSPELRARAGHILRRLEPGVLYLQLGDLWATDLQGMQARRIADAEADIGGVWGRPDGRSVAFRVRDELRLLDLVSGEVRPLFKLEQGTIDRFEWSPDGRRALVSAGQPRRVYLLDVETGENKRPDLDVPWASEHTWSPDGTKIAVIDRDGGGDRYDVALLGGEGRLLRRVSKDGGSKNGLRWSGDGSKVAYVVTAADPAHPEGHSLHVALLTLETGVVRAVTSDRLLLFSPSWSPDGGRIAFLRADRLLGDNPLAATYDLCIVRADGSELRALRSGGITYQTPAWSPDGRFILFLESSTDGLGAPTFNAGVVRPDGSDYRKLPGSAHHVSWIPGRHLKR